MYLILNEIENARLPGPKQRNGDGNGCRHIFCLTWRRERKVNLNGMMHVEKELFWVVNFILLYRVVTIQ